MFPAGAPNLGEVGIGQHEAAGEGRPVDVQLQLHAHALRQLIQPLVQRLHIAFEFTVPNLIRCVSALLT